MMRRSSLAKSLPEVGLVLVGVRDRGTRDRRFPRTDAARSASEDGTACARHV